MKPLISAAELLRLAVDGSVVIADVSNGKTARSDFETLHLANAVFIDLTSDLAQVPADFSNGGRHPLPNPNDFAQTLSRHGIAANTHVVAYDSHGGANAAARFWWMLKALGHEKVQVLNGGLQNAIAEGFPVSNQRPRRKDAAHYPAAQWQLPLASIDAVALAASREDFAVVDVREPDRYFGNIEPFDPMAGHIPGAINIPFRSNLDKDGLFLSRQKLRALYLPLLKKYGAQNTIVHCGSGVTACHTLLAVHAAGLEIPQLYVGSWSEWSRNGKPIAR